MSCYYYSLRCAHQSLSIIITFIIMGIHNTVILQSFVWFLILFHFHAILQSLLNAGNLHIDNNELLSLIAGCCNHHMVSCIIIHFVNNVINYYCSKNVSDNN